MMIRFALLALLAGIIALFAAPPTMAQSTASGLPAIDARGVWHRVMEQDETTSHRCVGNPISPHCALTTFFACRQRADANLCRQVKSPIVPPPPTFESLRPSWYEYHIVSARRLSANSPINRGKEGPLEPQDGDLLLGIWEKICFDSLAEPACQKNVEKNPLTYVVVRKQGAIWTVPYHFQKRF